MSTIQMLKDALMRRNQDYGDVADLVDQMDDEVRDLLGVLKRAESALDDRKNMSDEEIAGVFGMIEHAISKAEGRQ